MNSLPCDFIAIDTNIFEHLFDSVMNTGEHISKILAALRRKKTALLIDSDSRINEEYKDRLIPRIEGNASGNDKEIFLLEYWLLYVPKEMIDVNHGDELMIAIKGAMGQSNSTDRIFVYVAFRRGRILITNDKQDIIDKGTQEKGRLGELLNKTRHCRKKYRPRSGDKSDILTSKEAYERL